MAGDELRQGREQRCKESTAAALYAAARIRIAVIVRLSGEIASGAQ
jgi:hypothetical protein